MLLDLGAGERGEQLARVAQAGLAGGQGPRCPQPRHRGQRPLAHRAGRQGGGQFDSLRGGGAGVSTCSGAAAAQNCFLQVILAATLCNKKITGVTLSIYYLDQLALA